MDNAEYIEIWLSCHSEREDVSISCGVDYENENEVNDLRDEEWIFIGLAESFWENHYEFEDGINKAKKLIAQDKSLSFRQALFTIFGHFYGIFFVNGKEMDLGYDVDFDEIIYDLLSV